MSLYRSVARVTARLHALHMPKNRPPVRRSRGGAQRGRGGRRDPGAAAGHEADGAGAEGGEAGGYIVAAGTPEEVARVADSYTGQFLGPALAAHGRPVIEKASKARRAR